MINLTKEQTEIVKFNQDKLVIQALAGTGKTTTLIEFAKKYPQYKFLYLSFNRAIADEAKTKFGINVEVKTVHSIAYNWFTYHCPRKKIVNNIRSKEYYEFFQKINNKVDYSVIKRVEKLLREYYISNIYKIEDFLKNNGVNETKILTACTLILKDFFDLNGILPVTHDVYLKFFQITDSKIGGGFTHILFDESQDSNDVITAIVMNQDGRKIFVGDKHQSIYQFRGARDALTDFEKKADQVLSLTQTFRYGDNLAKMASKILNVYKDDERKIQGLENDTKISIANNADSEEDFLRKVIDVKIKKDNQPLCLISRLNKPLIKIAKEKINKEDENIKFFFNGDLAKYNFDLDIEMFEMVMPQIAPEVNPDLAKDLLTTKKKRKHLNKFNNYNELFNYVNEIQCSDQQNYDEDDICQSYERILEDVQNGVDTKEYIQKIKEVHTQNKKDYENNKLVNPLILTTAHVAKGLEWDNVFIYDNMLGDVLFEIDSPFDLKSLKEQAVKKLPQKNNLVNFKISKKIKDDLEANKFYGLTTLDFMKRHLNYYNYSRYNDELNLRINLIYVAMTRAKKNIFLPISIYDFLYAYDPNFNLQNIINNNKFEFKEEVFKENLV